MRDGGWRERILRHFTPQIASAAPLTIVSDADHLLGEQDLLESIRSAGFEVAAVDDRMMLRHMYEGRYRSHRDQGRSVALVLIVREGPSEMAALPYDVITRARRNDRLLLFSLTDIFPTLSPSVVTGLDRAEFDLLYAAASAAGPPALGDRATRDFVLHHVFDIAPEQIREPADLIRLLLRRHYRDRQLSPPLDARLIERLREQQRFGEWPLERIVPDRDAFFAFLQERWPRFVLRNAARKLHVLEPPAGPILSFPGPADLPFDHPDVRVYVNDLFMEGLLRPTRAVQKHAVEGLWLAAGVAGTAASDENSRFEKLTTALRDDLPADEAGYRAWLEFGLRWFEWLALRAVVDGDVAGAEAAEKLWQDADSRFTSWMRKHHGSLHNLAYLPNPAMLHHVLRHAAHQLKGSGRIAFLVLDGMAGTQWVPIRQSFAQSSRVRSIRESAVFAWVPTITPVSRQAIFAGEAPWAFAASIGSTSRDEQHWRRFWETRGLRTSEVQFVAPRSQEPEPAFLDRLRQAAGHPACRALAAIIPTVDEMVHGAVTGTRGLHAQVRQWAGEGHLEAAVAELLDLGYTIHVTSDHGNVECVGIGKPNVGLLAGERGERVHVFQDRTTRAQTAAAFPASIIWEGSGLPDGYHPLIAAGRGAFATAGRRTVSHGGVSLEEVIVPYVTIEAAE